MKQKVQHTRVSELLEWGKAPEYYIAKFQGMPAESTLQFSYDEEEDEFYVTVITYRLETDEEEAARLKQALNWDESLKVRRYENYLKLRKEFENDPIEIDIKGDLD